MIETTIHERAKYGTYTKNNMPTIRYVEILMFAFLYDRAKDYTHSFSKEAKKAAMEKYGLTKYPMALANYKGRMDEGELPSWKARLKAFELYKLGFGV